MFFKKKKTAVEIIKKAKTAAAGTLLIPIREEVSIKDWLGGVQGDIGEWSFFATIACAFLALQRQEHQFSDRDFRKLTGYLNDGLKKWEGIAPDAFYELASFIITSMKHDVGSVSACGLWVVLQVKDENPTLEEVTLAYNIGCFLDRAVAAENPGIE